MSDRDLYSLLSNLEDLQLLGWRSDPQEEPRGARLPEESTQGSSGPLSWVTSVQHVETSSLHAAWQLFTRIQFHPFLGSKRGTPPLPRPVVAVMCTRVQRWEQHRHPLADETTELFSREKDWSVDTRHGYVGFRDWEMLG